MSRNSKHNQNRSSHFIVQACMRPVGVLAVLQLFFLLWPLPESKANAEPATIPLPPPAVRLDTASGGKITFWELHPQTPATLRIEGPSTLQLQSRQRLNSHLKALQRAWIYTRIDQRKMKIFPLGHSKDAAETLHMDGRPVLVGPLSMHTLSVPAGNHLLRLETSAPLLARLTHLAQPALQLQARAQPKPVAEDRKIPPQQKNKSLRVQNPSAPTPERNLWEAPLEKLTPESILTWTPPKDCNPTAVMAFARQLALTPRFPDGPLLGVWVLQKAASKTKNPDYTALAERLLEQYSEFRDLFPELKIVQGPQSFRWTPRVLGNQNDAANRRENPFPLIGAYFLPVPDATVKSRGKEPLNIQLSGDLLFDLNAAELSEHAHTKLRQVAHFLEERAEGRILVIGHTDSSGHALYNQKLSERRAQSVARLLAEFGLNHRQLIVRGRGEDAPQANNQTPQGRTQNRRVEILAWGPSDTEESSARRGQRYRLPPHQAPTSLRILAHTEERQQGLWIQIDQQAPRRLSLEKDFFQQAYSTEGEAYLSQLNRQTASIACDTLGGPFSVRHPPAPLLSTLQMELTVPAKAHEVRIWKDAQGSADLRVALQYRCSRPLSFTETHFLNFARSLPVRTFPEMVRTLEQARHNPLAAPDTFSGQKWQPLVAWLLNRTEDFAAKAKGPGIQAQRRQQYLENQDPAERRRLFRSLDRLYRKSQNREALQGLWATQMLQTPSPNTLRTLTEILVNNGEYQLAMLAGLALAEGEQPPPALLQASFRLEWWTVFSYLLNRFPMIEQRHFWAGIRSMDQGDLPEASRQLRRAGPLGQHTQRAWQQGQSLFWQLQSTSSSRRLEAIAAWSQWQNNLKGPMSWREEPHLVVDYAGADTFLGRHNQATGTGFRSTESHPVHLRLAGPLRLRMEARPLLSADAAAKDSWLQLREKESLRLLPLPSSDPDRETLLGRMGHQLGSKVEGEFYFGPGYHDVEVSNPGQDTVIRVFAHRPELPLNSLPHLTPELLIAAAKGELVPPRVSGSTAHVPAFSRALAQDGARKETKGFFLAQSAQPIEEQIARAVFSGKIEQALRLAPQKGHTLAQLRLSLLLWLSEKQPDRSSWIRRQVDALCSRQPGLLALVPRSWQQPAPAEGAPSSKTNACKSSPMSEQVEGAVRSLLDNRRLPDLDTWAPVSLPATKSLPLPAFGNRGT